MKLVETGNRAVSLAVVRARAQVISAYPITPQTTIVEFLSELVADGKLDAKFINVESEHSAMAACVAASATGARTFTATSSQGLALMHEMLHWAAGGRLPVVMGEVSRAMAPPWSIWCDQNDVLSQRDTGWMQFFAESNQEAHDLTLLAYRLAETVYLPAMVALDAFILSHTSEPVEIREQEDVDAFLPPFKPLFTLDAGDPRSFGALAAPEHYMEFRYDMQRAMERALGLFADCGREFERRFGVCYDLVEEYETDDAERVFVVCGALSSTVKLAVSRLRDAGERVGVLKMVVFRPFPAERVASVLAGKTAIVLDRNISFGSGGVFASEIRGALSALGASVPVHGYVLGLGGRDVSPEDVEALYAEAKRSAPKPLVWWGLKR